jgi:hypothetical protein
MSAAGYPSISASPIGTDFDLSAVPLYSLSTSTESNMQTISRNRDSRRIRTRCGRVAAKGCADERIHFAQLIFSSYTTTPIDN